MGGTEQNISQGQQEMLGAAVNVAGQLDAMVGAAVAALDHRLLNSAYALARQRAFTEATSSADTSTSSRPSTVRLNSSLPGSVMKSLASAPGQADRLLAAQDPIGLRRGVANRRLLRRRFHQ